MRRIKLKKCKRVVSLHFAPDGGRMLVVGASQAFMVETAVWIDLATGETISRFDQLGACGAVAPDLSRYAVGGAHDYDEGTPVQWTALPAGDGWQPGTAVRGFDNIFGMAIDRAGTRLAVGRGRQFSRRGQAAGYGWEHAVTVERFDAPGLVAQVATAGVVGVLAFNADGTRLAVSGGPEGDPVVEVFGLPGGERVYRFDPPGTRSRCLAYAADGRLVVSNARNIYVLPPDRPEPQLTLGGHKGQVNAVTLSPDGRQLLSASHDGAIRIWDAATGEPVKSFDWQMGPVTAVSFAPDGLTCAAAGEKGQVVIWDVDG